MNKKRKLVMVALVFVIVISLVITSKPEIIGNSILKSPEKIEEQTIPEKVEIITEKNNVEEPLKINDTIRDYESSMGKFLDAYEELNSNIEEMKKIPESIKKKEIESEQKSKEAEEIKEELKKALEKEVSKKTLEEKNYLIYLVLFLVAGSLIYLFYTTNVFKNLALNKQNIFNFKDNKNVYIDLTQNGKRKYY